MKYTIEHLASRIADKIIFESCVNQKLDLELIFDKCVAHVEGTAYSYKDVGEVTHIESVDLSCVELVHEDCDVNTLFVSDELINLEKDIKLWW